MDPWTDLLFLAAFEHISVAVDKQRRKRLRFNTFTLYHCRVEVDQASVSLSVRSEGRVRMIT